MPSKLFSIALFLSSIAMPAMGQYIVGHRGASHTAPENTLAAFSLAWDEGADGAEGDFRLTADGQIVCMHDADTKRTAGKKLVVAKTSLAALQQLDVGSWKHKRYAAERPPTLTEVLEAVPDGKRFFIELKTGPEIVEPLRQVLANSPVPVDHLVIIAFDDELIHQCKQAMPDIKAHWLAGYKRTATGRWSPARKKVLATLKHIGADGLGSQSNRSVFNERFLSAMRAEGLGEFHVWTVDDPDLANFYLQQGAWSITTNRPGWLREQLQIPRK